MINPKVLVENPELMKSNLEMRGRQDLLPQLSEAQRLYQEKHTLLVEIEEKRARRNKLSEQIPTLEGDARQERIDQARKLRGELAMLDQKLHATSGEFETHLRELPNLTLEGVPAGGQEANRELSRWGESTAFDFKVKDHVELSELLGILDIERAAKVSGSRFAYLTGDGVLLELALVDLAIKTLVKEGFIPVIPPVLIRKRTTKDLGYWHTGNHLNYYLVHDAEETAEGQRENPLYLIGTAEHAIVPMHSDELFDQKDLPRRYAGYSSCFRREAGSYGKDVRGVFRVHQFDKVEMVSFVSPAQAAEEHRFLVAIAEGLMQKLRLPYRLVELATGDISFPAARTIDIETWIPSQNRYRETHSISETTDYQSRRLNTRVRTQSGIEFVHILNGTAFAIGRIIVALLENYQQADGSVVIPEVLRPFMGKDRLTPASQ